VVSGRSDLAEAVVDQPGISPGGMDRRASGSDGVRVLDPFFPGGKGGGAAVFFAGDQRGGLGHGSVSRVRCS
jgi:hypothetical protein